MGDAEQRLPRLTYENVMEAQVTLAKRIRALKKDNRSLREDEVDSFFKDWSRATLGMTSEICINSQNTLAGLEEFSLDCTVFNFMVGDRTSLTVGPQKTRQREAPMGEVWHWVLYTLYSVIFGPALNQAAKMSPEKDDRTISGGLNEGGLTQWGRK